MLTFTCLNLLVSDLDQSREFYTAVFGEAPVCGSPNYAQWHLPSGIEFGLVKANIPASAELVFETDDADAYPEALERLGAKVLEPPCDRRFGRTAVLADLDAHRLRLVRSKPAAA
ncbi:MAG: drug:proton antiporter [Armatimonadota bacterium]